MSSADIIFTVTVMVGLVVIVCVSIVTQLNEKDVLTMRKEAARATLYLTNGDRLTFSRGHMLNALEAHVKLPKEVSDSIKFISAEGVYLNVDCITSIKIDYEEVE